MNYTSIPRGLQYATSIGLCMPLTSVIIFNETLTAFFTIMKIFWFIILKIYIQYFTKHSLLTFLIRYNILSATLSYAFLDLKYLIFTLNVETTMQHPVRSKVLGWRLQQGDITFSTKHHFVNYFVTKVNRSPWPQLTRAGTKRSFQDGTGHEYSCMHIHSIST